MSRQGIIERERRWAPAAAAGGFAVFVLLIGAIVIGQGGQPIDPRTTSELLREFHEHRDELLLASILQGLGRLAMIAPLLYLFHAASARSEQVRHGLIGLVVIGPLFLGISTVLQWVGIQGAADEFLTPGGGAGIPAGEYAEDLISEEPAVTISGGLAFAGTLAFVVGGIYTALHSMRTGLLTRFFATLGMALMASLILPLPFVPIVALALWFGWAGLVMLDRVPGGRPPAWDAGQAIPWPKGGQREEAPGEEPADPRQFEVDSSAVTSGNGESPHAARRDRARKRKRKRRR